MIGIEVGANAITVGWAERSEAQHSRTGKCGNAYHGDIYLPLR
jgi:hypothetical protein